MAYVTLTHWKSQELTDEMLVTANEKFIPMIMQVGADNVQIIRTGALSICVITQYQDAETATAAQQRIAHIRSQAASEFPMIIERTFSGEIIAGS